MKWFLIFLINSAPNQWAIIAGEAFKSQDVCEAARRELLDSAPGPGLVEVNMICAPLVPIADAKRAEK